MGKETILVVTVNEACKSHWIGEGVEIFSKQVPANALIDLFLFLKDRDIILCPGNSVDTYSVPQNGIIIGYKAHHIF